jgi:DNA invertase Pin-like site-specific DNA recombinase
MEDTLRLDGYIRVSRVGGREGDSFQSPEVQREQIARWAEFSGHEIVDWHHDLDQSGGKMDRPGFTAMMLRCERGETEGVVVAKLDRFGRTLVGALGALARLDEWGAQFVSVAEQFDTTTPAGRMVLRLMLTFAEYERERITEGWAITQERAIGRGVHFGTPFGYEKATMGGALVPNGDAPLVRRAFEMRAEGKSWGMIADWLSEHGGNRGSRWIPSGVMHMVRNRAYLGEAWHGKHAHTAAHEPIVDVPLWHRANRTRTAYEKRTVHLLSGQLRCAGCRHALRINPKGRRTVYECRRKHAGGVCRTPASIAKERIEDHVLRLVFDKHAADRVYALEQASVDIDAARMAVDEAEEELRQFVLATSASTNRGIFAEALAMREAALAQAREALARAEASAVADLPGIFTLEDMWEDMDVAQKRRALRAMFDCAFVRAGSDLSERVHVCWPGTMPEVPRQGVRPPMPIVPFNWPGTQSGVQFLKDGAEHSV